MNKKQNYTAPEVVSLELYPRESVLDLTSALNLMAVTLDPSSDPIIESADFQDGVNW